MGSSSLIILLPVVDFPQPLSPTRANVSPGCKEKSIPSTACILPVAVPNRPFLISKRVVSPLTSMRGASSRLTVSRISKSSSSDVCSLTSSPSARLMSTFANFAGSVLPFMLPSFGTADNNAFV